MFSMFLCKPFIQSIVLTITFVLLSIAIFPESALPNLFLVLIKKTKRKSSMAILLMVILLTSCRCTADVIRSLAFSLTNISDSLTTWKRKTKIGNICISVKTIGKKQWQCTVTEFNISLKKKLFVKFLYLTAVSSSLFPILNLWNVGM